MERKGEGKKESNRGENKKMKESLKNHCKVTVRITQTM